MKPSNPITLTTELWYGLTTVMKSQCVSLVSVRACNEYCASQIRFFERLAYEELKANESIIEALEGLTKRLELVPRRDFLRKRMLYPTILPRALWYGLVQVVTTTTPHTADFSNHSKWLVQMIETWEKRYENLYG